MVAALRVTPFRFSTLKTLALQATVPSFSKIHGFYFDYKNTKLKTSVAPFYEYYGRQCKTV